jgi:Flp pilus assembly protein TadG
LIIQRIRDDLRRSDQVGQSLLIGALMFLVLIGVAGLAVDGAIGYAYSVSIERAAAAAALAGVPYLPQSFKTGSPNAISRAKDEATRNGFDITTGCTSVPTKTTCPWGSISFAESNNNQNLDVSIAQKVPTYFMQALGVPAYTVTRTAEAGFRAPIGLGSPDNEFGSTVSEIGTAGHFYVLRQKGWHVSTGRGEGDAYGPDPTSPYELGPGGSTDVHAISGVQGNESADPNFLPNWGPGDRGGQNFRITIPANSAGGELQVYNAGFGPSPGQPENYCENWKGRTVCNADVNQNYGENGSQANCVPGDGTGNCAGQQGEYNTVMYTLFQVNDTFLRADDRVLVQTKVYPIDAKNYAANPPSYINAKDGKKIIQHYDALNRPTDMRTYRSWTDISNENGVDTAAVPDANAPGLVSRVGYAPAVTGSGTPIVCGPGISVKCPALPPGTYRLRVDLLDANGNFNNTGSSNHGFSLRVVKPGTRSDAPSPPNVCSGTVAGVTTNCTVAGWEDAVHWTPLVKPGGGDSFIPLFQLTKDYAGSTIDVDLFDFGDVSGGNNVAVIDPTMSCTGACDASPYGGVANPGVTISNNGINRNGSPLVQHICGSNSQCPSGLVPVPGGNDVPHLIGGAYASWCVANCPSHPYNGTWVRVSIPIPGSYNPAPGKDFWYMRYSLTGTANDTFSYAVSARGGPVHLLKS